MMKLAWSTYLPSGIAGTLIGSAGVSYLNPCGPTQQPWTPPTHAGGKLTECEAVAAPTGAIEALASRMQAEALCLLRMNPARLLSRVNTTWLIEESEQVISNS